MAAILLRCIVFLWPHSLGSLAEHSGGNSPELFDWQQWCQGGVDESMPNYQPTASVCHSGTPGCVLQPFPLTVRGSHRGARSLGQKDTFFTRAQLWPR